LILLASLVERRATLWWAGDFHSMHIYIYKYLHLSLFKDNSLGELETNTTEAMGRCCAHYREGRSLKINLDDVGKCLRNQPLGVTVSSTTIK
jgi:hypothetical protein